MSSETITVLNPADAEPDALAWDRNKNDAKQSLRSKKGQLRPHPTMKLKRQHLHVKPRDDRHGIGFVEMSLSLSLAVLVACWKAKLRMPWSQIDDTTGCITTVKRHMERKVMTIS